MNYIWEPLIKMMQQDINLEEIHYFVENTRVSPYMELQADSIYEEKLTRKSIEHIDVNPYMRFAELFEQFVTPDDKGYGEFNQGFSDVLLHYLADIDLKSGMRKREFYIKFIIEDMEGGVFGSTENLKSFSVLEKRTLADRLLTLYETSDYINCFISTLEKIFPFCQVLIRDCEEIVLYMREKENEISKLKLNFIIKLFLPIQYPNVIHWTKTYGITGYNKTMYLEEFVL